MTDIVSDARKALTAALGPSAFQSQKYTKPKIIHDPIWGTCVFDPWEVAVLELPILQRMRGIKQTGLAYFTYPSAEHSRFQHILGVTEATGQLFDSIVQRLDDGGLSRRGHALRSKHSLFAKGAPAAERRRWRCLLRLAALVHDIGHSVFSHSSERIYSLISPFPELIKALTSGAGKAPGAAEVVVYLIVTSEDWKGAIDEAWHDPLGELAPPTAAEWDRVGRWVMGQEADPALRFLADIISGPFDADKLDYVFRDGYAAGIPVGYDLERLINTVCVDPQQDAAGTNWWRLTLPVRGVNALEQLVMGRLVLNSYLYHHQKCRAAESTFERLLAREYMAHGTVLGRADVWELFDMQDADAIAHSKNSKSALRQLLSRNLPVRVGEFRRRDIPEKTEEVDRAVRSMLRLYQVKSWGDYAELTAFEDELARVCGLSQGAVIVDAPKPPGYADLENVLLPGRFDDQQESPSEVLNYSGWIGAYNAHRAFIRIFAPRGVRGEEGQINAIQSVILAKKGVSVPRKCFLA